MHTSSRWLLLLACCCGLVGRDLQAVPEPATTASSPRRTLPIPNTPGWPPRRGQVLAAMEQIMGPLPGRAQRTAVAMRIDEEVDCGDYSRRSIHYSILPEAEVPAYLLVPKTALGPHARRAPGVLALHQTHPNGQKVVVGLGQSPDDEYGVELVRRGYVVLAPPYPMLANYWPDPAALGFQSGTMLGIWINIRGLDLLDSLPFVRRGRYAVIGHSLGGHNGVFTAAFDERLRVVVSSCGLDSFRDYYGGDPANWVAERGWCQVRYMPRLAAYRGRLQDLPFDFPDVLAAIAPRRVFLSAPMGDSNFRWQSVDRVVAEARPAFLRHRCPEALEVVHPDGPHRFPPAVREESYRRIDAVLRP
jgi:hypothetical protein